jgi:uncharacterized protein YcbX
LRRPLFSWTGYRGGVARVASIALAPVKGLALVGADEVLLEPFGVRGNRRFHLIGEDGRLVNGKFVGRLVQVVPTADDEGTELQLRFPDGSTVGGPVELGDRVETNFHGRPVRGRLVGGPYSAALSDFAERPLRLVRVDEPGDGCDRGVGGSVSLVSTAGLDLLARESGVARVDGRRFRMLFTLDDTEPNEEDAWLGRRVAIGDAIVTVHGLVGRCVVTSQHPDTGDKDLDTLRTLRGYRPEVEGEEPLPMGVWGSVDQPGRVRVGDTAEAL